MIDRENVDQFNKKVEHGRLAFDAMTILHGSMLTQMHVCLYMIDIIIEYLYNQTTTEFYSVSCRCRS